MTFFLIIQIILFITAIILTIYVAIYRFEVFKDIARMGLSCPWAIKTLLTLNWLVVSAITGILGVILWMVYRGL